MTSDELLGHLAYKIANATINPFPMPHFFIENVFPADFYWQLVNSLPSQLNYTGVEGKYKGRKFNDTTELALLEPLKSRHWTDIACFPFKANIVKRFGGPSFAAHTDLRLVMDGEGYSIGPHTDARNKVLSYLFYLPNVAMADIGTSIYLPKDQTFRCPGGPHHDAAGFVEIARMPFRPNSLFAFFKTDFSFHGVEPITMPCRRDVLLWNLYGSA